MNEAVIITSVIDIQVQALRTIVNGGLSKL